VEYFSFSIMCEISSRDISMYLQGLVSIFKSTPPSQPNKAGLDVCPSIRTDDVRPSTKSFSNSNNIWYVDRGR